MNMHIYEAQTITITKRAQLEEKLTHYVSIAFFCFSKGSMINHMSKERALGWGDIPKIRGLQ
jgi:hypothetical protein